MKEILFVKMHGAGNDFVMIDDRDGAFPVEPGFIARLAQRPTGVGCEGVILVQRSATRDFRMRFFNPDGSEAELCGNGARCVAAFARTIGAAKADRMVFETAAGDIAAEIVSSDSVKIAMPPPKDFRGDFVVAGVPHRIVIVDDLEHFDVDGEGRRIRYSEEFAPAGTNVDFVRYERPGRVFIRTYERGVEAESFACGTGSVAAAVIGVKNHGLSFPVEVTTAKGCKLLIGGRYADGQFEAITLTGPVATVFRGKFLA